MKPGMILIIIGLISSICGIVAFKVQHRFVGRLACYTTAVGVTNHKFLGCHYTSTIDGFALACTICGLPAPYITQTVKFVQ